MDRFSALLEGLGPNELDRALQVLQSFRAQQQVTEEPEQASTAAGPQVGPVAHRQDGASPGREEERGPASETVVPPDDFDDVPLAFGKLAPRLTPEEIKELTKEPRGHRKEAGGTAQADGPALTEAAGTSERRHSTGTASKKPDAAPMTVVNSLASFGFVASAQSTQGTGKAKNLLFSTFVPDRRIIPRALQFDSNTDKKTQVLRSEPSDDDNDVTVCSNLATDNSEGLAQQERTIDIKHAEQLRDNWHSWFSPYQTTVSEPYRNFDREVIFNGFFAIGYDPYQARPPYFGTYNHLQEGNLNTKELQLLGRFPLGTEMPRLSVFDYEYDSGDDWDVMDGEDVGASSSSESNIDDGSVASSDMGFVVNDDDGSDSECELQQKVAEARQRRMSRLRGKDKLISSFSGPFIAIPPEEHPLQGYDRLEKLLPLGDNYLAVVLEAALSNKGEENGMNDLNSTNKTKPQQIFTDAALKNRRDMTDEEMNAVHEMIAVNSKVATKTIVELLRQQELCSGVSRAEIERTVKRFYERKHGILLRRELPWEASDERLFVKASKKKTTKGSDLCDNEESPREPDDGDEEVDADKGDLDRPQSSPFPQHMETGEAEKAVECLKPEEEEEGSPEGRQEPTAVEEFATVGEKRAREEDVLPTEAGHSMESLPLPQM